MRANPSIQRDPDVRALMCLVQDRLGAVPGSIDDLTFHEQERLASRVREAERRSSRSAGDGIPAEVRQAMAEVAQLRAGRFPLPGRPAQPVERQALTPAERHVRGEAMGEARGHLERALRSGRVLSSANRALLEEALARLAKAEKKLAKAQGLTGKALKRARARDVIRRHALREGRR